MTEQQARDCAIRHAEEMERRRKDAERYRWLREFLFAQQDLDAAIDEAMK